MIGLVGLTALRPLRVGDWVVVRASSPWPLSGDRLVMARETDQYGDWAILEDNHGHRHRVEWLDW